MCERLRARSQGLTHASHKAWFHYWCARVIAVNKLCVSHTISTTVQSSSHYSLRFPQMTCVWSDSIRPLTCRRSRHGRWKINNAQIENPSQKRASNKLRVHSSCPGHVTPAASILENNLATKSRGGKSNKTSWFPEIAFMNNEELQTTLFPSGVYITWCIWFKFKQDFCI